MSALEAAQAVTEGYVGTGNVVAVVVAGSVGRSRADAFSDLELDVYWRRPPTEAERLAPVRAVGARMRQMWAHEPAEAEWSEDLTVDGLDVTISGFTASWLDVCIEQVTTDGDADVLKQMRLSALNEGIAIHGQDLIAQWRLRSTRYPPHLAVAAAASYLTADRLRAWSHWRALSARGDVLALRAACVEVSQVILGSLCAVNGVLIEHPSFKWLNPLLGRLTISPPGFPARFVAALNADAPTGARDLAGLLDETLELLRKELPQVSLDDVCAVLDRLR